MKYKDSKEQSSENNPPRLGITEMLIEDLKSIESDSDFLLEALTTVNRRAKQARRIMETNTFQIKTPEPQPKFYKNGVGGRR